MSNYTKITDYAAKDALLTGDPAKLVKGTEIGADFDAVATAIATKADTNSPILVTPAIGTPSSGVLTNCTGLPVSTGVTGLGAGVGAFLATPSSANLASAVTGETGSGALVFSTSPTLVTPELGVASATTVNGLTFATGVEGAGGSGVVVGVSVSGLNESINNAVALGDTSVVGANSVVVGNSASADNLSVAIGKSASCGYAGTTSVVVGASSGRTGMSGTGNAVVGYGSATVLTTGSNNTIVGKTAGTSLTSGSNNSLFGNSAEASSATVSNEITLGNSSIATLRCQVTSITALSDARDKTDVIPLPSGIDTVMALNPVRFTWNMRDGGKVGIKDAGFIAQDLQTVDDEYLRLVYAENPEKLEASYGRLIPVLVKAIQELQQQINELKGVA